MHALTYFFAETVKGSLYPPWVGATRGSNKSWNWSTGLSVSKSLWASGEPSIYGDCATLRAGSSPGMTACPCFNLQPALCKIKPKLCNGGNFGAPNVRSGSLNSPGFPVQYYNNLDCNYDITGPEGTYITITFDTFLVESFFDYVEIYGGNSSELIGTIDYSMPTKSTFESPNNLMRVYFHSDSQTTDVGWSAHWNAKIYSTPVVQSGSNGEMSSPNYPNDYDAFTEQMYYVTSTEGTKIFAAFDSFRTEPDYDYLEIYDGGDMTSKLLAKSVFFMNPGSLDDHRGIHDG
ncbi:unnamed protein product [Nippostrongylus brasiliensis]|uniref:CUB domain-containing protein n=1 Tax=Nippostrongylus brasiliensis TaxID=27835 RepID=A0A0N4YIJ0_NIPBR|nr:unnamed protein product [Nippostrongylus brasiliensis]